MRWAIVHRVDRLRVPLVFINDVPEGVTRTEVEAVLEAAGVAHEFSDVPEKAWSGHRVLPELRWPAFDHQLRVREWAWTGLQSPKGRRISLEVSPALHSRITLQAAAEGVSMASWCAGAFELALTAGRNEGSADEHG